MSKNSLTVLAKAIARKRGLSQEEAEQFIIKMFEVANEGLQTDKLLKMKWLGTFKVTAVKDRESIDVNTGERILIEGRDKITFTPDNILKEIVNKPFAQFETVVVNDGVDFSDIDEKFAHQSEDKVLTADLDEKDNVIAPASSVKSEVKNEVTDEEPISNEDTLIEKHITEENLAEVNSTQEVLTDEISSGETSTATSTPIVSEPSVDSDSDVVMPTAEEHLVSESVSEKTEASVETNIPVIPVSSEVSHVEDEHHARHFMIPKYAVVIVCLVFFVLLGGIGWLAFSYGKMQAQRDSLVVQLQNQKANTTVVSKTRPSTQQVQVEDSGAIRLRKKATEDSVRMAASSQAVEMAERTEKSLEQSGLNSSKKKSNADLLSYDADPRVRTGAYRIVGISQTITVKRGQTFASISKLYLGPGMECYMEALNGFDEVKEGQKVKIPKLELKKSK